MHVSGLPIGIKEFAGSALNTGVLNSTTSSFDVSPFTSFVVSVVQSSGTITGSVVTIQTSLNGSDWFDSVNTVAGELLSGTFNIVAKYMRLKVTTASAIASTADILIRAR